MRWVFNRGGHLIKGMQYVAVCGGGGKMFALVCCLGLASEMLSCIEAIYSLGFCRKITNEMPSLS